MAHRGLSLHFRSILVIGTLSLLTIELGAQSRADSLRTVWQDRSQPDSSRIDALVALAWDQYMFSAPDSAELLAREALDLARTGHLAHQEAMALNAKAISHAVRGDLRKAIADLEECMAIQERLGREADMAGVGNNLGLMYVELGESQKAFDYFSRTIELAKKHGLDDLQASALINIGHVHLRRGNRAEAMKCFRQSLRIRQRTGDKRGEAAALSSIADIYLEQQDWAQAEVHNDQGLLLYEAENDLQGVSAGLVRKGSIAKGQHRSAEALAAFQQALATARKLDAQQEVGSILLSIAGLQLEERDWTKAGTNVEEALRISRAGQHDENTVNSLLLLGRIEQEQGHCAEAFGRFEEALRLARNSALLPAQVEASQHIYECHKQLGHTKESLVALEAYITVRDSLRKVQDQENELRQQLGYEFRNKALADSLSFAKEAVIKDEKLRSEKRTRYFLIAGLLMLIVFGAVIYNRFQVTRKQKEVIAANARKLSELDELKNRFFTNISHEFRTPLTLILGPAQRRKKALANAPDQDAEKDTDLILQNGQRLLALIDQILDLNKLEAGKLKGTVVQADAMAVVGHLYRSLYSLAEAKGVTMDMRAEPETFLMDLDREKLTKVVHNLVSNAIKFTPAGGRLDLLLQADERRFRMRFTDTGIGILPADLPHVFDRFYQSSRTPDDQMGSGVGLALTQELVRSLGGNISVESTLDVGSTFTVELPVARTAEVVAVAGVPLAPVVSATVTSIAGNGSSDEDDDRTLVLVVEDNADMAEHIAQSLGEGYRVVFAENGRIGVEKALELVPDIVVSDVMMPVKDGFALVAELKADERTSHVPVVLLTARSQVEDRISGLKRGADDYLSKPFHAEELELRVRNLLALRNRWKERYAQGVPSVPVADVDIQPEDAFITKVKEALHANLDNSEYGANEIAEAIGMSRSPYFRKMKALTGESPANYIRRLRLLKAKELLEQPDMRISEVAYAVGFSDPKYFTKSFTKLFGKAPSEARA